MRGKVNFIISAFHPFITEQTLKELKKEALVVSTSSKAFIQAAKDSDITVMGGGPLMDIESLSVPLSAFRIAQAYHNQTVIFGCGLGPLLEKRYLDVVKELLLLSTSIKLRDSNSVEWAKELSGRDDVEMIGDPASQYIQRYGSEESKAKKKTVACFLRDWPEKYKGTLSEEEYQRLKDSYEANIASAIKNFCNQNDLKPEFYCMHTFVVGGDDRAFYRRFTKKYFSDFDYYLEKTPSSVDQIVSAMKSSSYNICMRFHSVLFANTLETEFFAVDYTNGGKILGYLEDHNKKDRMLSLLDIAKLQSFDLNPYFKVGIK